MLPELARVSGRALTHLAQTQSLVDQHDEGNSQGQRHAVRAAAAPVDLAAPRPTHAVLAAASGLVFSSFRAVAPLESPG